MGRHLLRALIANGMVRLPERALMHAPNRRLVGEHSGVQTLLDSPIVVASDGSRTPTAVAAPAATELLFVDSRVRELNGLLAELFIQQHDGRSLEVIVLDAQQDGIEPITATLTHRSELLALHLIGQEQDHGLQLGESVLSWQSLLRYAGVLSQWQTALRADGELYVYGTDWNRTASGRELLEAIRELTGISRVRATPEVRDILCRDRALAGHSDGSAAELPRRHELVFADANLLSHPLLTDIQSTRRTDERIDVAELDPSRDGLEQITRLLSLRSQLDAVYVLSQAAKGAFRFGSLWLHAGNLFQYATLLRRWRAAFASDAELLLIAQAERPAALGSAFLDSLSSLLGIEAVACLTTPHETLLGMPSVSR